MNHLSSDVSTSPLCSYVQRELQLPFVHALMINSIASYIDRAIICKMCDLYISGESRMLENVYLYRFPNHVINAICV